MVLNNLLASYKERLQMLNDSIAASAANYNQKDNDLKQLLANYNTLLGQQSEAMNAVQMIEQLLAAEDEKNKVVEAEVVKDVIPAKKSSNHKG